KRRKQETRTGGKKEPPRSGGGQPSRASGGEQTRTVTRTERLTEGAEQTIDQRTPEGRHPTAEDINTCECKASPPPHLLLLHSSPPPLGWASSCPGGSPLII